MNKTILQTLKLLLPALIPSWRFFDTIAPSPRIELSLLKTAQESPVHWQEFCPRPEHLTISTMLKRMFWNSGWNESLFLVSCSERLLENPTEHSQQEIINRIKRGLKGGAIEVKTAPYFKFRLVLLSRQGAQLQKQTVFISSTHKLSEGKA